MSGLVEQAVTSAIRGGIIKEVVKGVGGAVGRGIKNSSPVKVIKGIGPVLEKNLNELNITAYDQISKMTIEDLTNLLNGAGINAKIYDLEGWKAQATLALKGAL